MLRINKRQLQFYIKAGRAKIIFADSMPRSGSTLIFNALRLLLKSNPDCDLQSAWVRDARSLPRANCYLIKTHGMNVIDAWRASRIVYSYRDPRVALVSLQRKFEAEPSIEYVRAWMRDFEFAEQRSDIMVRYETMREDLPATVARLAEVLGVKTDLDDILKQLNSSQGASNGIDKATLLHGSHATGTTDDEWRSVLSPELNAQIVQEFGPWLERQGYALS